MTCLVSYVDLSIHVDVHILWQQALLLLVVNNFNSKWLVMEPWVGALAKGVGYSRESLSGSMQ